MSDNTDGKDSNHIFIAIRRRRWYAWLFWGIWLLLEIFFLQAALASRSELEERAAMIYGLIFLVLFLSGAISWFIGRQKPN